MGILQIKFAALVDVRCVKQSNSDAMPAVTNGVDQTLRVDGKETASSLISSSNKKPNLSKDPSPGTAFSLTGHMGKFPESGQTKDWSKAA